MIREGGARHMGFLKKYLFNRYRQKILLPKNISKLIEKSLFSDQDVNFDCRKTQSV